MRTMENITMCTMENMPFHFQHGENIRTQAIDQDSPYDMSFAGRMYEKPERALCPVKCFELYLSKINPEIEYLWQGPNKLSQMMILYGIVRLHSARIC